MRIFTACLVAMSLIACGETEKDEPSDNSSDNFTLNGAGSTTTSCVVL